MAEKSAIEWTDATWNPWYGCNKISPGCAHCYAERWANRTGRDFSTLRRSSDSTFYAPSKWKDPRRVFVCSLSDFFHPQADLMRSEAWNVIYHNPQHTYLFLTKRPGRAHKLLPADWYYDNTWFGVSAENQRWADRRIPFLRNIPAAVRFVSCEPLLGPIDLAEHAEALDWVIVGGESGPKRRPLDANWVRQIRDQCVSARIPFFFKQWGGLQPKSGGRTLDGKTWNETPAETVRCA